MPEISPVFEATYRNYLVRFNDCDREFPAQCAVLFPQSAEVFLDMECMAIGGTLLAGTLTRALHDHDGYQA